MEYWMVKTGDGPGIDGGLIRRMTPGQSPATYFADPEGNPFGVMEFDQAAA